MPGPQGMCLSTGVCLALNQLTHPIVAGRGMAVPRPWDLVPPGQRIRTAGRNPIGDRVKVDCLWVVL